MGFVLRCDARWRRFSQITPGLHTGATTTSPSHSFGL